jgi:hypothetical protein
MIGPFQSEARMVFALFAAPIGIGLLAPLIAPRIVRSWRIDRCLDHGGRYSYDDGRCEFVEDGTGNEANARGRDGATRTTPVDWDGRLRS